MKNKVFKSLDEQIEILKEKGLVISDYDKTKEILFRENYFFISGYRHLLMAPRANRFLEGTTFEELYAIFCFDRHIRNIMFKYLLIVENNVKSIISYQLSKKYGIHEKSYLDPKNFTQDSLKVRQVHDVLNKMKRQIHNNCKRHTATVHYLNNYGYIPLWILVKVLSFGIISELYHILKVEDQQSISDYYQTDVESLGIYLVILANFRNLCAHEDILYEHHTQRMIPDNKYHKLLSIPTEEGEYIYGKNDLFAVVLILKQMLEKEEFLDFVREVDYEISLLDGKVDVIPLEKILNKIGFPSNWNEIKTMD